MGSNKTLDLTIRIAGKMDKSLLSAINGTQSRVSDLAKNISRVGTVGLAAMGTLAADCRGNRQMHGRGIGV